MILPSGIRRRYVIFFLLLFTTVGLFLQHTGYKFDPRLITRPDTGNPASSSPGQEEGDLQSPSQVHEQIEDVHTLPIETELGSHIQHEPVHLTADQQRLIDEYDPERWHEFELNDFYGRNSIVSIQEERPGAIASPYTPYPAYNSIEWRRKWQGQFAACEGSRGLPLNESQDDVVKAYPLSNGAFPPVSVGDANATGIDLSVCFDRYHRYGPYGYEQTSKEDVYGWTKPKVTPDWTGVDWGALQGKCLTANEKRYKPEARQAPKLNPTQSLASLETYSDVPKKTAPSFHHRTAILIRTWEGFKYKENDRQALRALITETALLSGGEYHVFLFVNVKDLSVDLADEEAHERYLKEYVPQEFHNISVLWNERTMQEWYPLVGDWQVYWSQFMSLQWFSKTHPEFDFLWNWEMDVRYTGNHYSFLEGAADFALQYPRKYMWERNTRYYFPFSAGSYKEWLADTDLAIEKGIRSGSVDPVWGPKPYNATSQKPIGPKPPTSIRDDQFSWGVGEEADLITLLPIWDPVNTRWDYRDKIWNFVPGVRPHFTPEDGVDINYHYDEFKNIPRRVYINTVSRFSKRLLHAMHLENLAGRTMQAEMWPATVALHHGLKAVYAPHPIWMDRRWPEWYAEAVFNADGGNPAQWSIAEDSVYAHDRERNYKGWSWYYISDFAQPLYRRWLGLTAKQGSPLEVDGRVFEDDAFVRSASKDRLCLPGMLLHPIKDTDGDN